LVGANGATKTVGLLETDGMLLAIDRARPVRDHCLLFLVRDARYRPESIIEFAVGTLILDKILEVGVAAGIILFVA